MFDIRKIQEGVIFQAVKEAGNEVIAEKVVYGENQASAVEDNASWVKNTMQRLEASFSPEMVKKIRMACQCGYVMDEKLKLLQELMDSSSDIEGFANQEKARAAGLSCVNGELLLQFPFCPCPMLAEVDMLPTKTWCECTTGYSKVLFEKAFGCRVDVELLKSIKMGDDICLMKIVPEKAALRW